MEKRLRRDSTTSSNSLIFDTPNSSFSRTTTINNTNSILKNDCETQIINPSYIDMIKELIYQMNKNANYINYNPAELAKNLFQQSFSLSTHNKYPMINLLVKKTIFIYWSI